MKPSENNLWEGELLGVPSAVRPVDPEGADNNGYCVGHTHVANWRQQDYSPWGVPLENTWIETNDFYDARNRVKSPKGQRERIHALSFTHVLVFGGYRIPLKGMHGYGRYGRVDPTYVLVSALRELLVAYVNSAPWMPWEARLDGDSS